MEIDSARELKARIDRLVLAPLARREGRRIDLAAQPFGTTAEPHRTVAVGIAPCAETGFRLAVRIQRREMEGGMQIERIRSLAKGEIDVRYIGRIVKRVLPWHRRRNRPLRIGGSIGHYGITAGTLGCFVRRRSDEAPMILSNNHVLADENRAEIGDAILQPGRYDGGRRGRDAIGYLADFVRLKPRAANAMDCAVANLKPRLDFDPVKLTGLGRLGGLAGDGPPEIAEVAKVGRTTGLTRGRITAFEIDNVIVGYDSGNLRFDDQIEIEGAGDGPFSDGGDSGSLIVDAERRGIALLFAGSDQGGSNDQGLTYANPLPAVLRRLRVDLLT
ncbi:hypothetical protein [Rhodospirillaceae bacterium SYSU D60014]|uniref:hypothetical protein n=1 Tax=Virgifigura deserti TaxID=2268457 RepID=UPI000E669ABC